MPGHPPTRVHASPSRLSHDLRHATLRAAIAEQSLLQLANRADHEYGTMTPETEAIRQIHASMQQVIADLDAFEDTTLLHPPASK